MYILIRGFLFFLFLISFNSHATFYRITRDSPLTPGLVVGNYFDPYVYAPLNRQTIRRGTHFTTNYKPFYYTASWDRSDSKEECPFGTVETADGICEEIFCEGSLAAEAIAQARNNCPAQDKFTPQCDESAKSAGGICEQTGGGDGSGGDGSGGDGSGGDGSGGNGSGGDGSGGNGSGGNGTDSNGNNGCVINCNNSDNVDPTKTFCSSSAANSSVNSARAYCAMRAGGNNFNFIIQSCSELTKKVKTKCEIDNPDSGGGDSGGDGSGTTDPDNNNSDNSDVINKLSKLDSANILGLDAIKKTNTDGFNGIGKLTKDGFDTIDKTNKDGFGELGKTTKDGFGELGKTNQDGFGDLAKTNKNGFDSLGEKLDGIGDSLDALVDGFSLEKTIGLNVPDHKKVLSVNDIIKLKKDIVDKKKELNQTIKTGFDDLKQSFTLNVSSSGNDSDLGFTLSVAGHSFNVSNPLSSWSKYYNELGMVIMMLASMSAVVIVCSKN